MKKFVIAGALVAFASGAIAADEAFPRRFKPNQFEQVVELIEANMQPGGEWEATSDEQTRVRALLGEVGGLLEGNERIADLDQNEKDAIEKRRAEINSILTPLDRQLAADGKATGARKHRKSQDILGNARAATTNDF